ncbi:MAG: dihydrolipoamide acetyltransferase family protein [Opitutales bacterium]
MAEIIEMPKLSDTMSAGTIVNWLKQEGDSVSIGDMLCEVETDKATMELENLVADGVILKIYSPEGEEAPLGAPICAIGEPGEEPPTVETGAASAGGPPAEKGPAPEPEPAQQPKSEPQGRKHEYVPEKSMAEQVMESPAPGGRIKASPLARKLAEEKGLPLHVIRGSGPGGRITRKDVEAAAEKGISASAGDDTGGVTTPAAAHPGGAPAAMPGSGKIAEDTQIKLSNMRKTIARRLVESKTQIPHFYLETEADAGPLMDLRAAVNANLSELPPEQGGLKLSVNDFVLKAATEALRRVPGANASWMGDHIAQHGSVHLAFGVAVPEGLLTPVIRDAQAKSLRTISAEAKSLIKKARDKKLGPDEMTGSTFTVTNLGMYGVTGFYGIINPPNAAILSIGATVKKPVVDKNDHIVIGRRMSIGLSGDHRIIDGATGAEYLKALVEIIETPALMLV